MKSVLCVWAIAVLPCLASATDPGDAKKACVRVWATATADGSSGSGTVVASGNGRSLVVTCNHIFSGARHPAGGFVDNIYPKPAKVRANDTWYAGTAVTGDRASDLVVIVVGAELTPAPLAATDAAIGSKIWRNGAGTGYQTGSVVAGDVGFRGLPNFSLVNSSRSDSGDSGAGYFNESGELVGVHCGADTMGRARGTAVSFVKTVLGRPEVTGAKAPIVKVDPPAPKGVAPGAKVIVARLPAGRPVPDADGCVRDSAGNIILSYPLVPEWFDFPAVADADQEIITVNRDGTSVTKTVTVSGARWPGLGSGYVVVAGPASRSK